MKLIVCISAIGNQGKTEIVCNLANLLATVPGSSIQGTIPVQGDFTLVVTANGKSCGLESCGDPSTGLYGRLEKLALTPCEVIVCASRSKGDTVDDVKMIARNYQYEVIWTSPYIDNNPPAPPQPTQRQQQLNALKSEHIRDLLAQLGVFP